MEQMLLARFSSADGVVSRAFDSFHLPPSGLAWVADATVGGVVSASLVSRRLPFVYAGDVWHTPDRPVREPHAAL